MVKDMSAIFLLVALVNIAHGQSGQGEDSSSGDNPPQGSGQSRLLFVGGKRISGESSSVELIPNDASIVIPEYPHPTATNLVGEWLPDGVGVVCGGYESDKNLVEIGSGGMATSVFGSSGNPKRILKECYRLERVDPEIENNFTWTEIDPMNIGRSGAASVILPGTNTTRNRIWVTGGESGPGFYEKTSEIFTPDDNGGKWEKGPELPLAVTDHCLVQIDQDRTLLNGGRQSYSGDPKKSRRSFVYDWRNSSWSEVGSMNIGRCDHACAKLSGTKIGAVGGRNDNNVMFTPIDLEKIDVFDSISMTWSLKNQQLPLIPEAVIWGQSFNWLDGKLLLLGGECAMKGPLDHQFEYGDGLGFKWVGGQYAMSKRSRHLAIPFEGRTSEPGASTIPTLPTTPNTTELHKVLLVGSDDRAMTSSELLSVSDGDDKANMTAFPMHLLGAQGQLVDGSPVICGGHNIVTKRISDLCFTYESKSEDWTEIANLNTGRKNAASLSFKGEFWVLGGESRMQIEMSTEILGKDENGTLFWRKGPEMPFGLTGHCVVKLDDDKFFLIGGSQREQEDPSKQSRHVFLYDSKNETETWQEMAPMSERRFDHSCGLITVEGAKKIVVAGGQNGDIMVKSNIRQIEIYDVQENKWTLTNQTVGGHHVYGLHGSALINLHGTDPSRLFLIGGTDVNRKVYSDIYEYEVEFGFVALDNVTLSQPRYALVALPIENGN